MKPTRIAGTPHSYIVSQGIGIALADARSRLFEQDLMAVTFGIPTPTANLVG